MVILRPVGTIGNRLKYLRKIRGLTREEAAVKLDIKEESIHGIDMGQKRLFNWMRNNEFLIKRKGSDWNMPTQKSMELKLFEVKESTAQKPDGSVQINKTTKVTGKGQQYFINKFLGEKE